jgi:glycopeptide antibiotics resistance protein
LYYSGSLQWIGNFIMLMPLAYLLGKSLPQIKTQTILILSLLTTIFIEYVQIFIPGRVSDVRDITANSTGVILFLAVKSTVGRQRA